MNEINDLRRIWRGKRTDNGEWVRGSLLRSGNGYIDIIPLNNTICEDESNALCVGNWYVVDSETLGECTGLTDRNGKPIFEGDILETAESFNYIVKWSREHAEFYAESMDRFCVRSSVGVIARQGGVIIGNIYDNPEMKESGEQNGQV